MITAIEQKINLFPTLFNYSMKLVTLKPLVFLEKKKIAKKVGWITDAESNNNVRMNYYPTIALFIYRHGNVCLSI